MVHVPRKHKHAEEVISSDESEAQKMLKKRNKHKKRRKNENGSGEENSTPDMEAVLNQMAIAFEVSLQSFTITVHV